MNPQERYLFPTRIIDPILSCNISVAIAAAVGRSNMQKAILRQEILVGSTYKLSVKTIDFRLETH